jgi:hypothetical protein
MINISNDDIHEVIKEEHKHKDITNEDLDTEIKQLDDSIKDIKKTKPIKEANDTSPTIHDQIEIIEEELLENELLEDTIKDNKQRKNINQLTEKVYDVKDKLKNTN